MAKVYLESTDTAFTISNNNTTVYGATGDQVVTIASGVTGVTYDQNTERVVFGGASSAYTYLQSGNQILVYSGGVLVATIPVQGDTNGTQLTFSNGTANAILTSGVMALGGTTVSSTAAATVTPATIDATVTSGTGTTVSQNYALTASADSVAGTNDNNAITGVISSVATSTTFNATDSIIDTNTSDTDSLTLSIQADVTAANSGNVRGIETINVNADATVLTDTNLDFDATNFTNVKTYNFDVTKTASAFSGLVVTAMANNNATVNATDKFSTVSVAGTGTGYGLTVDAKAVGASGSPTTVTVTGALGDVTITGAGYLTATSNASTGLLSVTAAKTATVSATAAKVINATATSGNLTISDATASVHTTATASGDVSISKLDAAGKVTVTAGGTITLAGTTAAGTDIDATSAVLSGVGTSTIADADAMTSLTLSGNGAAATYDMTAGSAALTDVAVSGTQNVTLKLNAANVAAGASTALSAVDTGTGTFTLELKTGAGAVDLRGGQLIDVLAVNVDETATLSVLSGQTVTYKQDQSGAAALEVGALASASTNTVAIKLDDGTRDTSAVDLTALTVTQAKTITIDGSIDTTSGGSANTHTIKTLDASVAKANVTINMGVNNLEFVAAGATTVNTTGSITVTGSGTLTDAAGMVTSLTAGTLDASAMTGAVTLDSTTTLAVNTIKTGSANDAVVLTTSQDQAVQMNDGTDTLTLAGESYANKAVSIDMGAGTDTLKFVSGTQLIKGTSGVNSLAGVENIKFGTSGTEEIQASLLSGQTYAISSPNTGTASTNNIGVIVASTDTAVNLSTLVGSTAVDSTIASMTFTTDANANTASTAITGVTNAKNIITGSSASDSLTGGTLSDTFNYSVDTLLFSTGTSGVANDTIVGGSGTDSINFTATGTAITVLGTTSWANISGVEKITTAANSAAISLTLGSTAQTAGITAVDLSGDSNTAGVNVVNASAFTSGVSFTGSAGAGVDSLTGGSGNDTFVYSVAADLFSGTALVDSIVGGSGTDTIQIGKVDTGFTMGNTIEWGRASSVETIKALATTTTTVVNSLTLDVTAYAAGIRTVDFSAVANTSNTNIIDATEIIGVDGLTLIGSATGVTSITGGSGNDTMSGGSANDTFVGGLGSDSISLTAGGTDTVTLATSADTITGFTAGANGVVAGYDILAGTLAGANLVDAAAIVAANTPDDITVITGKITELNYAFTGTTLSSSADGTALLFALKGINSATDVALTTAGAATGFLLAYQNNNAYVYSFNSATTGLNTDIGASDITLIATLTGVTYGALVADNFSA